MKVITKEPGKAPEIRELQRKDIWDYLGGCMETVGLYKDFVIICNDDFLFNGSEYNVTLNHGNNYTTAFYGNIFICKIVELPSHERDLGGLTDTEATSMLEYLNDCYKIDKEFKDIVDFTKRHKFDVFIV